jgi:hypothetical protein
VPVLIASPHQAVDAADRLRREVTRQSVEPGAARSQPLLRGRIENLDVRLHLQRVDLMMRSNRSWSVELRGRIAATEIGSELRGTLSIGHPAIWLFLTVWRVLVLAMIVAGAVAVTSNPPAVWLVLAGFAMVGFSVAIDSYGTRRGRVDAEAMVGVVTRMLA